MTNLIVKMLTGNKYCVFGISFVICIGSYYLILKTPFEKVYLNCMYISFCACTAPFMGWNFARIAMRD